MRTIATLLLLLLLASGCGRSPGQSSSSAQGHGREVKVQQTAPEPNAPMSNAQIADHLEQLAMRLPNVQHAHVVMLGNTAIVGINVDPKLDRSKVGSVKYTVAEALRKDPYGASAIVTADMDLDERIRRIGEEVRSGRPVSGFADELGKIIGRIMPQLPRDTTPAASPPPPVENQPGQMPNQGL